MEKINTPLWQSIERKQWRVDRINELASPTINERMERLFLEREIDHDKSLLPTEREMIEKVWFDGAQNHTKEALEWVSNPKDYFTQTFNSYE